VEVGRSVAQPASCGGRGSDAWAQEFLANGWRGKPWVILKRVECSGTEFERIIANARGRGGAWLFDYYTYHLPHAPTHHVWASKADLARVVHAIEAFPAQRVSEFESRERASLESQDVPPAIIEQTAPRLDWRPKQSMFKFPVLVFSQESDGGEYTFLPGFGSLDVALSAWVREAEGPVTAPLALLVLLTCHGNPTKNDTRSLFSSPLHPNRLRAIRAALRARSGADDPKTIADELQRALLRQVPEVVASLRSKPPLPGRMHSVARSRLVEAVCRELLPERRRKPKPDRWWDLARNLEPTVRRAFRHSLTPAELSEVRARQSKKLTQRQPSSSRTLLARAKAKLTKLLRAQSTPPS
jgi:hypothetical protein